MTRVPLESRVVLCVNGRGLGRLHKLNSPLSVGDGVTCFVASGRVESRANGRFYVIELERISERSMEQVARERIEVPCRLRAVPIQVTRRVYLDMVRTLQQYLSERDGGEVERRVMEEVERDFNRAYPKLLAIRTVDSLERSEDDLVFLVSEKNSDGGGRRSTYTPILLLIRKTDFKILVQKIASLAGVTSRFSWTGKRENSGERRSVEPDGVVLIFLDRITTSNRAAYQRLINVINHLEEEGKVRRILPRVFIFRDVRLAEQIKHIFSNLYKLKLLLARLYVEDNADLGNVLAS